MRETFGPAFESKERVHPGGLERHHFRRRQRGELRVARAMIAVTVRVHHEQREPRAIDDRQQAGHRLGERHALRVFNGTTVDEQGTFGSDEQIEQRRFEIRAQALAQEDRLGLVTMRLQRRLRIFRAVLRAWIPGDVEIPGDRFGQRRRGKYEGDQRADEFHATTLAAEAAFEKLVHRSGQTPYVQQAREVAAMENFFSSYAGTRRSRAR